MQDRVLRTISCVCTIMPIARAGRRQIPGRRFYERRVRLFATQRMSACTREYQHNRHRPTWQPLDAAVHGNAADCRCASGLKSHRLLPSHAILTDAPGTRVCRRPRRAGWSAHFGKGSLMNWGRGQNRQKIRYTIGQDRREVYARHISCVSGVEAHAILLFLTGLT